WLALSWELNCLARITRCISRRRVSSRISSADTRGFTCRNGLAFRKKRSARFSQALYYVTCMKATGKPASSNALSSCCERSHRLSYPTWPVSSRLPNPIPPSFVTSNNGFAGLYEKTIFLAQCLGLSECPSVSSRLRLDKFSDARRGRFLRALQLQLYQW